MIDLLVLLLSTDWFLPYWQEIGIDVPENTRTLIQKGCREIVDEILDGKDSLFLVDLSQERRRETESEFISFLRSLGVEREASATVHEWANMTHAQLSAAWACAGLNREIPSAGNSGMGPHLEFPIQAEVIRAWDPHSLRPDVFRDVCLSSNTAWDIRTRKILVSERSLVNHLWAELLDHRLRAFWADLHKTLSPRQRQELVSWYREMIRHKSKGDRPIVLPSYIEAG